MLYYRSSGQGVHKDNVNSWINFKNYINYYIITIVY